MLREYGKILGDYRGRVPCLWRRYRVKRADVFHSFRCWFNAILSKVRRPVYILYSTQHFATCSAAFKRASDIAGKSCAELRIACHKRELIFTSSRSLNIIDFRRNNGIIRRRRWPVVGFWPRSILFLVRGILANIAVQDVELGLLVEFLLREQLINIRAVKIFSLFASAQESGERTIQGLFCPTSLSKPSGNLKS